MPRWSRRRLLGVLLCASLLFTPVVGYGLLEPGTGIGYAVFRTGYALWPSRAQFLDLYGDVLESGNGSYVPRDIDRFLTTRWAVAAENEQMDVVTFYVAQPRGRRGGMHEKLDASGVPPLLAYLETPRSPRDQEACLELLEAVRRGRSFGKGGYAGTLALSDVEQRYREWWSTDTAWVDLCVIDPLADVGPCWVDGP